MSNSKNDGDICESASGCLEECPEDANQPSIYKRACKKITRNGEVVNKGCGWQKTNPINPQPDLIHAMLNSQNTDAIDNDECIESIKCKTCTARSDKNFNDLCRKAMQTYYSNQSRGHCLRKLKVANVLSVCFCSSDYCNSSIVPKNNVILTILVSTAIILLLS